MKRMAENKEKLRIIVGNLQWVDKQLKTRRQNARMND